MTDEKLMELAQDVSSELRDEDYWQRCPICDGCGYIHDKEGREQCPDCEGEGWSEL